MSGSTKGKRVNDLVQLLDQLTELHQQLTDVIGLKIRAMRSADMSTLQDVRETEKQLVLRIHEREGFRRQLMDALSSELGVDKPTARQMTLRELEGRVCSSYQDALHEAADKLRAVVSQLARNNRVAGVIAAGLVNHIRWVWSAVRPTGSEDRGYTQEGGRETDKDARFFETLG